MGPMSPSAGAGRRAGPAVYPDGAHARAMRIPRWDRWCRCGADAVKNRKYSRGWACARCSLIIPRATDANA